MAATQVDDQAATADKSLGELVATAARDVSLLVRSEIDLAKSELKADAKRAGMGAGLFAMAGFLAMIVLILLSIALGFGFVAMGIWEWAAFLIVAGIYVLLAAALVGIGVLRLRRLSGIPRTRETLKADMALLRRSGDATE